jgi:hypothetical protein
MVVSKPRFLKWRYLAGLLSHTVLRTRFGTQITVSAEYVLGSSQ